MKPTENLEEEQGRRPRSEPKASEGPAGEFTSPLTGQEVSPLAERLGVSREAVEIARASDVIDLHLDTFIPMRTIGYDLGRRHGPGLHRGVAFGHLDLPRARDGGLKGGMFSITTNPFRTAAGRWAVFQRNLARLVKTVEESADLRLARSFAEYEAVRRAGAIACLPAVQGGNALDAAPESVASVADRLVTRVTLVHLTNSALGAASTPLSALRKKRGLTEKGRAFVERCNAERVFVDLAHIHADGFWDAVGVHDRSQPLIDTHTGASGVTPHWRNLDDEQIKAIAGTGGTIGIIYSVHFLRGAHGHRDGQMIVEHMARVIEVAGEDFVSVGSDYDGAIVPPRDMRSGDSYPRLVQHMLDRGWKPERIQKILGQNFLRAFRMLRPV